MNPWLMRCSIFGVLAVMQLPTGCSKGGAPEGFIPVRDGSVEDSGLPWGRPDLRSVPDLMRPQPRTSVSFAPAVTYPSDQSSFQIASGRVNNDAFPDIVTDGSTYVSIYLNRGDGTFDVKTFANSSYWQIAVDDLSGDGLGDLALTDTNNARVGVARGHGDGMFDTPVAYMTGRSTYSLVAVDLTGDKALELVGGSFSDNMLRVLKNDGKGVFSEIAAVAADVMAGANPIWLSSADVNRDGRSDLLVSNYSAGTVNLLLGNGDGTLQPAQNIAKHSVPMATGIADFDFDGTLDFALVRETEQKVHIFLGKGDGTFTEGTPLMLSATTGQGVRAADVNGDAIVDVVAVCAFTTGARVFLGRGDGTFGAEQLFPGAGNPFNLVIADWNQDGLNDMALNDGSSKTISVLMNTTKP